MAPSPPKGRHVKEMNEYKGGSFPAPIIPISGLILGLAVPYGVNALLQPTSQSGVDGLVELAKQLPVLSGLFLAEFAFGAQARSSSTKASFSPAAAAASNEMPVELIEANRINQNHIESLTVFLPMAIAASIENSAVASVCTISWVICRFLYRVGYCNQRMPFWRIAGVSASMTQTILCAGTAMLGWNIFS